MKKNIIGLFQFKSFNNISRRYISTVELIKQRDNHFRSLLLTKENLTTDELANIARVLTKSNQEITNDEMTKFDNAAISLSKSLDNQELRQVMSLYVFKQKSNKFVFYELKERQSQVGLKDYTPKLDKESRVTTGYVKAFQLRNQLFSFISNITGLRLK